ncbi:NHL repeat-containing protein [candidate division KSB1 bacterium]
MIGKILISVLFSTDCVAQEISVKDGVRVVGNHAPAWEDEPQIELEFVRKYGGRNETRSSHTLYYPFDVVRDIYGNLLIVESGNHRLKKFSPEGVYIKTIGSGGFGDGEFHAPIAIDVDREGNIYVASNNNNRIQVLDRMGNYIRQIKGEYNNSFFRVLSNGNYVMRNRTEWSYSGDIRMQERIKLVREFDSKGKLKKSFGTPFAYKVDTITVSDRSYELAVDDQDNVYLAYKYRNLIEKYDSKRKLVLQISRPLKYTVSLMPDSPEGIGSVKPNRVSEGIDVGPEGNIWVAAYAKQPVNIGGFYPDQPVDQFEMHVFNNEGILLFVLPLNHFVDHIRLISDSLFIIDTHRNMAVYEYRIVDR